MDTILSYQTTTTGYPIPAEAQTLAAIALVILAVVVASVLYRREPTLTMQESKEMVTALWTVVIITSITLSGIRYFNADLWVAIGIGVVGGAVIRVDHWIGHNPRRVLMAWTTVMASGIFLPIIAQNLAHRLTVWMSLLLSVLGVVMILWYGHAIDQIDGLDKSQQKF